MKKLQLNRHSIIIVMLWCTFFSLTAQRRLEKIDRAACAVRTSTSQVFISWRVLGSDPQNTAFNLYRGTTKLNATPITGATNYTDKSATGATAYTVKTVRNGVETGESNTCDVWSTIYKELTLDVPSSGKTPSGETYTYSPNSASIGDVDGDGKYEIIQMWVPSNAHDNSQGGYTGEVYLDAYTLTGVKLWRINLGKNIRAGAHYNTFVVMDFDGDGKAEVACKTAPGVVDGTGSFLKKGPAATDDDTKDYRNSSGYILTGPEYLTVFNGLTGAEISTVYYNPRRHPDTENPTGAQLEAEWGDAYGNRLDRYLSCGAYLDGKKPSIVMCRGYYTRMAIAAWDLKDGQLVQRWIFDTNNGYPLYRSQGNHNLSVGDIDDDGKDEIVYGAAAFDDDGKPMYTTRLGHGDAMHLSDLDPDRKGLEVWEVHEEGNMKSSELHDARTGKIIWYHPLAGADVGRGCAADWDPTVKGAEMWSSVIGGYYSCKGDRIATSGTPAFNFVINWDGDDSQELLDGVRITDYAQGRIFDGANYSVASNEGTKATPVIQADIYGDWREEVIFRTTDNAKIRIFTTTAPTNRKLYTLMHDAQYRNAVCWQNTGYNQPPHPGFYLGGGMDTPPPSAMLSDGVIAWKSGSSWDNATANWIDYNGKSVAYKDRDSVMFDVNSELPATLTLAAVISPAYLRIATAKEVKIGGSGRLTGDMEIDKMASGKFILNGEHDYTGITNVWSGEFALNGKLTASRVVLARFAQISGKPVLTKGLSLGYESVLSPGSVAQSADTAIIGDSLVLNDGAIMALDLSNQPISTQNDFVKIEGKLIVKAGATIQISPVNGTLADGQYILASASAGLVGNLTAVKVEGYAAKKTKLSFVDNKLILTVSPMRKATSVVWNGGADGVWDLAETPNFYNKGVADIFAPGDTVLFNDAAIRRSVVLKGDLPAASLKFDNVNSYIINGTGSISGATSLLKSNTGTLIVNTLNSFTGETNITGGVLEAKTMPNDVKDGAIGVNSSDPAKLKISNATLRITGTQEVSDRGLTITGDSATLEVPGSMTWMGVIQGKSLIKSGAGTLAITLSNTSLEQTILKAGTLKLATEFAEEYGAGKKVIMQGGTLLINQNGNSESNCRFDMEVPTGASAKMILDGRCYYSGKLTGSGTLNLVTDYVRAYLKGDWSAFDGTMNVTAADASDFLISNNYGYAKVKMDLGAGPVNMVSTDPTTRIGTLSGTTTATITNSAIEVGARNENATFAGIIKGTGSVRKTGTGTWTLTGRNTYTGTTTINGGTILLSDSLKGNGSVQINSGGILNFNKYIGGSVVIAADGKMIGAGIVKGSVTNLSGGWFAPSNKTSNLRPVTISGNVNLQANSNLELQVKGGIVTTTSYDQLVIGGKISCNGSLNVLLQSGTPFSGATYPLFLATTIEGKFSTVNLPTLPVDLAWDLSELYTAGKLKIQKSTGIETPVLRIGLLRNPTRGLFELYADDAVSSARLTVANMQGKTIYASTEPPVGGVLRIDLSSQPNGIYLLQLVTSSGEKRQFKLVKE